MGCGAVLSDEQDYNAFIFGTERFKKICFVDFLRYDAIGREWIAGRKTV